ncbi:MAG: hypothetical protein JAZ17_08390 [Candidatus Thiodiazotropha endolucinida]|nr:hypothetical protein [Candidatus Thiodiazotropha endolucinida]
MKMIIILNGGGAGTLYGVQRASPHVALSGTDRHPCLKARGREGFVPSGLENAASRGMLPTPCTRLLLVGAITRT